MKGTYVSITFLIISGFSLRRKFRKTSNGAETQDIINYSKFYESFYGHLWEKLLLNY